VNQFNRIGVRFPILDFFNALKFEFSSAQRSYLGPGPPDLNFGLKALVLVPRVIAQGFYEPDVIRSHDFLPPIGQNKLILDARAALIWIKLELGKRSPMLLGMISRRCARLGTRRVTIKERPIAQSPSEKTKVISCNFCSDNFKFLCISDTSMPTFLPIFVFASAEGAGKKNNFTPNPIRTSATIVSP
jgi:hypothetical protein